jgi:hypothetical protein
MILFVFALFTFKEINENLTLTILLLSLFLTLIKAYLDHVLHPTNELLRKSMPEVRSIFKIYMLITLSEMHHLIYLKEEEISNNNELMIRLYNYIYMYI